jgi:hypothetical protein
MFQTLAAPPDRQTPFDVAVVIPTLLRPSLERAVRSVFAQDFGGRVQVLIGIDVAAGDPTILSRLAESCPPHMMLTLCDPGYSTSIRHGGLYSNRFSGALRTIMSFAANSRHIAYLDDDNWWDPRHLTTLHDAQNGVAWSFSARFFVDSVSGETIALDDWESVGPDRGVFAEKFGGFVDPSSLMIDKMLCHDVVPLWSISPFENGTGEDRLVFTALKARHPWRATGQATSFYAIDETDANHTMRLQKLRERGIVLPSEIRAGRKSLADITAGWPTGLAVETVAPPATSLLRQIVSRLKPREMLVLGDADGSVAAILSRLAQSLDLPARILVQHAWTDPEYDAVRNRLGPEISLLPPSLGIDVEELAALRFTVDLIWFAGAPDDSLLKSAWPLLRAGGLVLGEGPPPENVTQFAAKIGAGLLPAALDGAAYWIVQRP